MLRFPRIDLAVSVSRAWLVTVLFLLLLGLTACEGLPKLVEQAQQGVDQAALVLEETRAALDEANARIDALEASGEAKEEELAEARKIAEEAEKAQAKAEGGLETAQSILDKAKEDGGPGALEAIATTVGSATGHPEIILIGTTLAALWRARNNRVLAKQTIASVQPIVSEASDAQKLRLEARQSPQVKSLVDEAQGKKLSIGI